MTGTAHEPTTGIGTTVLARLRLRLTDDASAAEDLTAHVQQLSGEYDAPTLPAANTAFTTGNRFAAPAAGSTEAEDIVVERRVHDAAVAREWCERRIAGLAANATVTEIEVLVEHWAWRGPMHRGAHRPESESVQVGVLDGSGRVRWSSPRTTSIRHDGRVR